MLQHEQLKATATTTDSYAPSPNRHRHTSASDKAFSGALVLLKHFHFI